MKFPASQSALLLTLAWLVTGPVQAQTAAAVKPAAPQLRAVVTPETTFFVNGKQLLAKTGKHASSVYTYINGRLTGIFHADGRATTYHYQDGRLDRIVLSDGRQQKPIYDGDALRSLEGASGQRLGLAPDAGPVDKTVAAALGANGRALQGRGAMRAGDGVDALNRTLIAVENWELGGWECILTPEMEQICIGRPGSGEGGGDVIINDPAYPEPPGEVPPDNGEGGGGGGGGGTVPPNLPTLASCLQAAYNTWMIMRIQLCPIFGNQQVCLQTSYRLYEKQKADCRLAFPD